MAHPCGRLALPGRVSLDEHDAQRLEQLRGWLTAHAPPSASGAESAELLKRLRTWIGELDAAGLSCLHWPVEVGGAGASLALQLAVAEELTRAGLSMRPLIVSHYMAGPLLAAQLRHDPGSTARWRRHLDRIRCGDELWSQLFSEPGAGSDLAALTTSAVRDGDVFRISGQKVWSSYAHLADRGLLLARTGLAARRHQGLTLFALDLRADGVDVRPLQQLTGDSEFNEVFLTDVEVPVTDVIGDVDGAWALVLSVLGNERLSIGLRAAAVATVALEQRRDELDFTRPGRRRSFVRAYESVALQRLTGLRMVAAQPTGDGRALALASIAKLQSTVSTVDLSEVDVARLGMRLTATDDEGDLALVWEYLRNLASGIGGGTTEMQKNALAERFLGLPRDP